MYIRRVVAEVDRKEIYILIQRTEETQIIYRSILFRSFAVFDDIAANDDFALTMFDILKYLFYPFALYLGVVQ